MSESIFKLDPCKFYLSPGVGSYERGEVTIYGWFIGPYGFYRPSPGNNLGPHLVWPPNYLDYFRRYTWINESLDAQVERRRALIIGTENHQNDDRIGYYWEQPCIKVILWFLEQSIYIDKELLVVFDIGVYRPNKVQLFSGGDLIDTIEVEKRQCFGVKIKPEIHRIAVAIFSFLLRPVYPTELYFYSTEVKEIVE